MEPITNKEFFLAAAAGDSVKLPTPLTREEMYLKRIAERGGGSGGSGGADWNAPEGTPGHVLNRTHYEEVTVSATDTLTFDGNIEGKEVIKDTDGGGLCYVKLSDTYVESSELIGGMMTVLNGSPDEIEQIAIDESVIIDLTVRLGVPVYAVDQSLMVFSQEVTFNGMTFSKGIYTICAPGEFYVMEVKAPSAVFTAETTVLKKLDPKYLPEGVPYMVVGMTEILPETALASDDGEMAHEANITLEIGKAYKVTYNGTEYECVAVDGSAFNAGLIALGNYDLLAGTGDTGEPFLLMNAPGQAIVVMDTNGATSCTISIYGGGKAAHQLPVELLPKTYTITLTEEQWAARTNGVIILQESPPPVVDILNAGGTVFVAYPDGVWGNITSRVVAHEYAKMEGMESLSLYFPGTNHTQYSCHCLSYVKQ